MSREPLRDRDGYRAWSKIGTRWSDNDAYGHVNNTVHYQWFDTAVNSWLIDRGLLDLESGNSIGLVVETGCRYARPLSYPQIVDVGLVVDHIGKSSVRYRLGIFAENEYEAAAEGFFVHVYVERKSRTPMELPVRFREALEGIRG